MALTVVADSSACTLEINVRGTLTLDDYHLLRPTADRLIRLCGPINILINFTQADGWKASSLLEDLKVHGWQLQQVGRVAVVGNERWKRWAEPVLEAFPTAEVWHFLPADRSSAQRWLTAPSDVLTAVS